MKLKRIILISLILVILTIGAVSATENITDSNEGVLQLNPSDEIELNDDALSSSQEDILNAKDSGTFTALQERIDNANEGATIKLENDYVYYGSFDIDSVVISKPLTINGNGHTIDALSVIDSSSRTKIFTINASGVTLKNIIFSNAYTSDKGGAVFSTGENCKIINCTFTNSTAEKGGAAIYSTGANFDIKGSTFTNNTVNDGNGGAVYSSGANSNVVSSVFTGNNALRGSGGSVYLNGDDCTISNSTFTNNLVTGYVESYQLYGGSGGAIHSEKVNCSIINCAFINNQASDKGGAIGTNGENSNIINCEFTSNIVLDGSGGAIYMWGENNNVINCSFTNNRVNDGGGGAINMWSNNNVINCSFTNNLIGGRYYPSGGAIWMDDNCNVINCEFTSNGGNAYYAGAMLINGDNCQVINSTFAENKARSDGGAIRSYGTNLRIINTTFTKNHANGFGGAVRSEKENCNIINSLFTNNDAADGGATHSIAANFHVLNSEFINNTAYDEGGAIRMYGENSSILNSEFINDTAGNDGGAIYSSSNSNVVNCTFTNCTTSTSSGINASVQGVNYTNCMFDGKIYKFLSVPSVTVVYGQDAVFNLKFSKELTGYIRFTMNGVTKKAKVTKGVATYAFSGLNYGWYLVDVSYGGNYRYAADSVTTVIKVNKNPSPIVSLVADDVTCGDDAVITADLSVNVPGNVRFTVNNVTQKAKITDGIATATFTGLKAGTYDVTAYYAGNVNYFEQTLTDSFKVVKATPITAVTAEDIEFGTAQTIRVTLDSRVNGNVNIVVNGTSSRVKIVDGTASATFNNLKAGTYDVSVIYAGNANFKAQKVTTSFNVNKANPITSVSVDNINVGDVAVVTVKMAKNVNGNVRITVNGVTEKVQIVNGIATLNVTGLKAGTYEVSAVYAGNANFNQQTTSANVTVSKSSPGLSFTAVTKSGSTTVTASIAKDAPGNVKIIVDNSIIFTAKITNGVASYVLPTLTSGQHTIKVTYAGNYKYTAQNRTKTITI